MEDATKAFLNCFDLRGRIENTDIAYCGIALLLITLDPDVLYSLRKIRIQDKTLREILELISMKFQGKDISNEIRVLEDREWRKEMRILLKLIKNSEKIKASSPVITPKT